MLLIVYHNTKKGKKKTKMKEIKTIQLNKEEMSCIQKTQSIIAEYCSRSSIECDNCLLRKICDEINTPSFMNIKELFDNVEKTFAVKGIIYEDE